MKRGLCLLVTGALMAAMAAGCGGTDGKGGAEDGAQNNTQGNAQENQQEETGGGADGESAGNGENQTKEVIKVLSVGTEADQYTKTMRELAEEFSRNNEYGVTVEFELYENEQYKTKLATLMASNNVPDIFFTWELGYLEPFVSSGKVMSLQEALDADPAWRNSFLEGVLDYFTYDGETYAIPSQIAYGTMFYNQAIFEEYQLQAPETYEEFCHVCEVLKENGVAPMALAGSEAWIPAQFILQLTLGTGGAETYNAIMKGEEVWNNEAYIQAAAEAQKMVEKGWFADGMLAMSYDEAIMKLESGEAAMYYMASWDASGFVADSCPIKDTIRTFNMPPVKPEHKNLVVGSADTAYALGKDCANPEACIAFLKYITSKDWQERDLAANAKMPTVSVEVNEQELSPLVASITNNLKDASVYPWWDRAFGTGEGEAFNNACLAVFGGEDVQGAFDELQQFAESNADR